LLLLDLSPLALAYCLLVLLLNFTLRGSLGFGAALGLPLLALVLPVKVLAPAWSLVAIVSSAAIIGHSRRHVDRREYLGILPGCALGVAAGLYFFKTFDEALLARALGVFIIAYAAYSFWKPSMRPTVVRPVASFLSGAVGTLFGALAGVFFAMYLDAGRIGKRALRATLSAMLMTLSVVRTIGYAAVGELTADAFILCAAALPAMVVGLLVGERIHTGLSQVAFQRLVCAALAACGAALLIAG
jgi:uncharacterized membrane protein YfcA